MVSSPLPVYGRLIRLCEPCYFDCDMLSAHRAAEIGLINRVVKQDRLEETTLELARKIGSKSSTTLAIGKRAYYAQNEMGLAQAYNYARR